MSILRKSELKALRKSRGIVPDREDDTVQIWRRSGASVDQQTIGGYGIDERGYPVKTSGIIDDDPTNDTPGYTLYKTLYGRVESASSGRETDMGAQNTSVAPWDIVLPAIDDDGVEITIQPGDQLRVLLPDATYQIYEVISADDGETYGVLLTVRCQRIEQ